MIFGMLQADTWARSYLVLVVLSLRDSFILSPSRQVLFPELGLDLVEAEGEGGEEEHSLALSLSSWQVVIVVSPLFYGIKANIYFHSAL